MEQETKLKIFPIYYKENFIFKSDVYQPILISNPAWKGDIDIIKDNTEENIARKNRNYAELSGHYWVWKNFLPKNDSEYIGFCHYRRFLDFGLNETERFPFKPILDDDFKKIFDNYTQENILKSIQGYDIVLPYKYPTDNNMLQQYLKYHPKKDLDVTLKVISELYPDYNEDVQKFMDSYELYSCLNFVMKKELVEEYMEWIFKILFAVERKTNWNRYSDYMQVRMPAFLAERLFNVWLIHQLRTISLNILETTSWLIVGDGYIQGDYGSPEFFMQRYIAQFQYYSSNNRISEVS